MENRERAKVFLTGGSGFIGTNFVNALLKRGHEVKNYDLATPVEPGHRLVWDYGDIMDGAALRESLAAFRPEWVAHLAARVDCDENTTVEKGYALNVAGTENLLKAVQDCPSVRRLLVTSSQFVCGPGKLPVNDEDYFPATVYGASKVETERLTRGADLECVWTITRPTNVWGPYHTRYSREFWRVLEKGWYLHPGCPTPTRSYAYVGNVVWQMLQILEAEPQAVDRKTFYLGDRPIDIIEWIEGFHREITGREKMRVIPMGIMKLLGWGGDAISMAIRRPFYINSSRLRSMTSDYLTPMEPTFEAFGEPPYSLAEGIRDTVAWFKKRPK